MHDGRFYLEVSHFQLETMGGAYAVGPMHRVLCRSKGNAGSGLSEHGTRMGMWL